MKYMVISIPHTGTRTLRKLYRCGFVHTFHLTDTDEKLLKFWGNQFQLISPLRHPFNVWASWVGRHEKKQGDVPLELFEPEWMNMDRLSRILNIEFIPVDKLALEKVGSLGLDVGRAPNVEVDWDKIFSLPFVKEHYDAPGA